MCSFRFISYQFSNGIKNCADNSDELTEKCLTDNDDKLRGKCSAEQFQCKSGECIPIDNLCDGKAECSDNSDETVENCASKCCPPFGFRCGYGACIDEKQRCQLKWNQMCKLLDRLRT